MFKTNKIQKLIKTQLSKRSNSIKKIIDNFRFINERIFNNSIIFIIDELLDALNNLIKNIIFDMQRAISKYRVKKSAKFVESNQNQIEINEILMMTIAITILLLIITQVYNNNNQS